jgi:predicted porin
LARSSTVTGQNMSIALSGGFGTLMMGAIEIGSGIRGLAQAGAPVNNMEGEVLSAAGNSDIVKYTAPKMGDFTLSASLTEPVGIANGMGTGDKSATTVGVDYAAGPLKAKLDYTNYDADATSIVHRYRLAAQYDLGVVVVGYGIENQTLVTVGTKNKLTMLGLSAPLTPAIKVGFVVTTADASATAGKKTGNSYGISYAMSKRTSLSANAAKWEASEAAGSVKNSKTTILLAHSF